LQSAEHTDAITGDVRKNPGDHNHDSNAAKIKVVRTVTALKRRAVDTNEGTAQVINHTVQNLSQAVQGQLPSGHALKKVVRRQRVRMQTGSSYSVSPTQLELPGERRWLQRVQTADLTRIPGQVTDTAVITFPFSPGIALCHSRENVNKKTSGNQGRPGMDSLVD